MRGPTCSRCASAPGARREVVKSVDARDRADLLRIAVWFGGPCFVLLTLLWFFFLWNEWIGRGVFVLLLVLNVPLAAIGTFVINMVVAGASSGLVRTIYSAGDIPPPRTYPRQDTLIIRGAYAEAADYFRDHLTIEPDDHEARLRLADLLERHLGDAGGAERLYLEVRNGNPDRGQELRAANGLIDLYRKQGRRDRLMVELVRFAEVFRGSAGA